MADRLTEIESRGANAYFDDLAWLGAEVKQLRADLISVFEVKSGQIAILEAEIRRLRAEAEIWQQGTDELTAERDAARRALLACQEAREAQRDELAQYYTALDEMTTHCLCGCPIAEHWSDGDDGESCDHDDHECLRTCQSIAELVARLRTNQKETP